MEVLVVFVSSGTVGNADGRFRNYPPTKQDVRDMEKEIKEKFGFDKLVIVNWLPLSKEGEECNA